MVDSFVPVASTTRCGIDESLHFGAVVALDRDGSVAFSAGDPTLVIYPRSSNKPLQAVAMVRAGLLLAPRLLAVVCASHDGTPMHMQAAQDILANAGLPESALQNTPDLPLDRTSAEATLRAGGGPTRLQMNCSGKHSGMLACCSIGGWPIETYLESGHALQLTINDEFPSMTGEDVGPVGIDGCGAPAHTMSLLALATAFRRIAIGDAGVAGEQVYDAMTTFPEMVGGQHRDVTLLMRYVPGLLAKDGAEGVFAAALPDGRSVALKIADGSNRSRPTVMLAALRALGVDVSVVAPLLREQILGHGRHVGEVSCIADFVVCGDG